MKGNQWKLMENCERKLSSVQLLTFGPKVCCFSLKEKKNIQEIIFLQSLFKNWKSLFRQKSLEHASMIIFDL